VKKASQSHKIALPSNPPMHLTPLRVDKIVGILQADIRSNAFPI